MIIKRNQYDRKNKLVIIINFNNELQWRANTVSVVN